MVHGGGGWYVVGSWGGAWRVAGADAWAFLQSQAANDLGRCEPHPLVWTLWLDRSGHPQAATWVRPGEGGVVELRAECAPVAGWTAALEAMIIADEVELADCGAGQRRLTLGGDAVAALFAERGITAPAAGAVATAGDGAVVWASREVPGAWEVDLPVTAWPTWEEALAAQSLVEESEQARENRRIGAGIATVPRDIGPADLPQEGGLEREGVSYQKGCYLGQEVMARLQAQGRTRRSLVRVHLKGAGTPLNGMVLVADGQVAGTLRSFGEAGEQGERSGFALLKDRLVEKEIFQVGDRPDGLVARLTGRNHHAHEHS